MGKQRKLHAQRSEAKKHNAASHVSTDGLPAFVHPLSFKNYAELVAAAKNNVFLIARLRKVDEKQTSVTTLGTGFLAGNARMITNSHVINNKDDPHHDGDSYVFITRNENGQAHWSIISTLKMGETLFDFNKNKEDFAVIYLPRDFYFDNKGNVIHHPDDHLILSTKPYDIGTDIGVLGYPMQRISFDKTGNLNINGVLIRGDRGVVNTRYINDRITYYDFTTAFYPGNSGGPILNIDNGKVIAIVEGYRSVPIHFAKEPVPENLREDLHAEEVVSAIRSTYSFGLSTENYLKLKDEHDISFD